MDTWENSNNTRMIDYNNRRPQNNSGNNNGQYTKTVSKMPYTKTVSQMPYTKTSSQLDGSPSPQNNRFAEILNDYINQSEPTSPLQYYTQTEPGALQGLLDQQGSSKKEEEKVAWGTTDDDEDGFSSSGGKANIPAPWIKSIRKSNAPKVIKELLEYSAPVAALNTFAPEWAFNPTPNLDPTQVIDFSEGNAMPSAEQYLQLSEGAREQWQENAGKGFGDAAIAGSAVVPALGEVAAPAAESTIGLFGKGLKGAAKTAEKYAAKSEKALEKAAKFDEKAKNAVAKAEGKGSKAAKSAEAEVAAGAEKEAAKLTPAEAKALEAQKAAFAEQLALEEAGDYAAAAKAASKTTPQARRDYLFTDPNTSYFGKAAKDALKGAETPKTWGDIRWPLIGLGGMGATAGTLAANPGGITDSIANDLDKTLEESGLDTGPIGGDKPKSDDIYNDADNGYVSENGEPTPSELVYGVPRSEYLTYSQGKMFEQAMKDAEFRKYYEDTYGEEFAQKLLDIGLASDTPWEKYGYEWFRDLGDTNDYSSKLDIVRDLFGYNPDTSGIEGWQNLAMATIPELNGMSNDEAVQAIAEYMWGPEHIIDPISFIENIDYAQNHHLTNNMDAMTSRAMAEWIINAYYGNNNPFNWYGEENAPWNLDQNDLYMQIAAYDLMNQPLTGFGDANFDALNEVTGLAGDTSMYGYVNSGNVDKRGENDSWKSHNRSYFPGYTFDVIRRNMAQDPDAPPLVYYNGEGNEEDWLLGDKYLDDLILKIMSENKGKGDVGVRARS